MKDKSFNLSAKGMFISMKKFTSILLTLIFAAMFSITVFATATFEDNFTDSSKCVAKSGNIYFESDNPSLKSHRIIRQTHEEGFAIWRLEDLRYIELRVAVYKSSNPDMNNALRLKSSVDGDVWEDVGFSLDALPENSESGSGWLLYTAAALTSPGSKFIKVILPDTGDVTWSVALDNLLLFNSVDMPANESQGGESEITPPTNDKLLSTFVILSAALCGIIYLSFMKTKK